MSAQIFRGKFIFPRCIYIVIFKIMFCHSSSNYAIFLRLREFTHGLCMVYAQRLMDPFFLFTNSLCWFLQVYVCFVHVYAMRSAHGKSTHQSVCALHAVYDTFTYGLRMFTENISHVPSLYAALQLQVRSRNRNFKDSFSAFGMSTHRPFLCMSPTARWFVCIAELYKIFNYSQAADCQWIGSHYFFTHP